MRHTILSPLRWVWFGAAAALILATSATGSVDAPAPPVATSAAWLLAGNAGTTPGTNFLGTTDNQALELKVNGARALRIEPGATSPNLVGGFSGNVVSGGAQGATIAGGGQSGLANSVTNSFGTIGGGEENTAGSIATVAGGELNTASGSLSTVAGGYANTASGQGSFAAGNQAQATHDGSFVWADARPFTFGSTAQNEFSARATGGVRFVSAIDNSGNPTAGVKLFPGSGSWSSLSDRALKRNFADVDGSWILRRIAALPITTWNYQAQKPSIRHLGPTAQDFARAFRLGEDDRHIDTIDSEGVSLAAIKALAQLVQTQQREIDSLQEQVVQLERSPSASR